MELGTPRLYLVNLVTPTTMAEKRVWKRTAGQILQKTVPATGYIVACYCARGRVVESQPFSFEHVGRKAIRRRRTST